MTFSLVGRCAATGAFGAIVSSSSPAVAARCAHARRGVGAACTQNVTDPRLGPALLDRLAAGDDAETALRHVVAREPHADHRQLSVVDASGRVAIHSGVRTLGRHAEALARDCAAAGNLLATDGVPRAMVEAFGDAAREELEERLVRALEAGLAAGGEEGPVRSAGLVVVRDVDWYETDLRVDWHDHPIAELRRILTVWRPQARDYVTRGLDPSAAPSYGVPGDE